MTQETMRLEVKGNVAYLTMTRPDKANTVNAAFAKEFREAAETCRDDDRVRAVLLSSEPGRIFCAGGDLGVFSSLGDQASKGIEGMLGDFHPAVEIFDTMDAPLISVVDGVAGGAGFSLALASRFVLASERSKFCMAYTKAGLTPDGGSTYYLPRIVGLRRAEELMVTNRTLSAQEALDWGIINRLLPQEDLMPAAEAFAAEIASGATKAYGAVRRMLIDSLSNPIQDQLAAEGRNITAAVDSADGKEGINAFLNKRDPEFTGH